jgi:hypothetical protein
MSDDLNTRCTAALRALEAAGVIGSAWLPGMSTTETDLAYGGRFITQESIYYNIPDEPSVEMCTSADEIDLSDPVTAASIIVPVREAWGDPDMHCERLFTGEWVVIDGKGNAVRFPKGATETEAFVAALEAKVREVTP